MDLSAENLSVTANIVAEFYSNSIRKGLNTHEIIKNGPKTDQKWTKNGPKTVYYELVGKRLKVFRDYFWLCSRANIDPISNEIYIIHHL